MLVQISRRSYKAYSYSEVPANITAQNVVHLFTLIRHSGCVPIHIIYIILSTCTL